MSQKPQKSGLKFPTKSSKRPASSSSTAQPKPSTTEPTASGSTAIPKSTSEPSSIPKLAGRKSPTKSPRKPDITPKWKSAPRLVGTIPKASGIPKATSYSSIHKATSTSKLPRTPQNTSPQKSPRKASPRKTSPRKTSPRKEVVTQETQTSPKNSPKVIVSDPTGKVLDYDSDSETLMSPPKSPKKMLSPEAMQVDSGHSGSGSEDGSSSHASLTFDTLAWLGPKPNPEVIRSFKHDQCHPTDILHGTWDLVYCWPPISQQLSKPNQIIFAPASKMEAVLYSCLCQPDNIDRMAPIKVMTDTHSHIYTSQLVDTEEAVPAALDDVVCSCRTNQLTTKFVVLPINEQYVLHYEKLQNINYTEAQPNTVHLLYKGVPSTTEMNFMLRGLQVARRQGSPTFMAKYKET